MPSAGSPAATFAAAPVGDAPLSAVAGRGPRYRRRRPEETTLHALLRAHAAAFFARAEAGGARVPGFVRAEFDATLACGRPEHGIVRLRCASCGHDEILAFSCKRRGFCPACGTRRMEAGAAHLVERVFPAVPVRQFVLTLPVPLRLLLAARPGLIGPALRVVHRLLARHLAAHVAARGTRVQTGAVTVIQRFGSAANLNVHFHCLALDGAYRIGADGRPRFVAAAAPTPARLQALLVAMIARLMRRIVAPRRRGRRTGPTVDRGDAGPGRGRRDGHGARRRPVGAAAPEPGLDDVSHRYRPPGRTAHRQDRRRCLRAGRGRGQAALRRDRRLHPARGDALPGR